MKLLFEFSRIFTARKLSLRRLCFYTCLSVILFTGGGHVWGEGGMHGQRVCMPREVCMLGGIRGWGGMPGGMHARGVCVAGGHVCLGGMHGWEVHAWGACMPWCMHAWGCACPGGHVYWGCAWPGGHSPV